MSLKKISTYALIACLASNCFVAAQAQQQLLGSRVKMSIQDAERMAQQSAPGATKEIELEEQDGKLVYSVEIEQGPNQNVEVQLDAETCKLMKVEKATETETTSKSESGSESSKSIGKK